MNTTIKSLYRKSLKQAKLIDNINVKQFAIRRLKEDYRKPGNVNDAINSLSMLKRYTDISKLYWIDYYNKII